MTDRCAVCGANDAPLATLLNDETGNRFDFCTNCMFTMTVRFLEIHPAGFAQQAMLFAARASPHLLAAHAATEVNRMALNAPGTSGHGMN